MREDIKKRWARILTILLVLVVAAGLLPQTGMTVYASNGDPAMNLGTEVLDQNVNTGNAQTVWYAGNAWRVISFDGNGVAGQSGAATLLAAVNLGKISPKTNYYARSDLRSKVDGIAGSLSDGEKEAVVKRTLKSGSNVGAGTDCILGDEVKDAYLWPLSTKEANEVNKVLRVVDPEHQGWADNYWWLRSPGQDTYLALVQGNGDVSATGGFLIGVVTNTYGVRPALHLNMGSVLFTSAAEGGKSSGGEGADALKAQSDQTNSGNKWKVTLKSGHDNFEITKCTPTESSVSVKYEGAIVGTTDKPEYISALITDKPVTDSSAKIKYYGRIQECTSESGTVTINTAGKLGENDVLYVFTEQYNGDEKTDYASALQKVTIPDSISCDVTFKVANGSWNDGTPEDIKVTLRGYEGDTLKLAADQIPAVGNKPDEGYKEGSWEVVPNTETAITEDTTYTYTYAAKNKISATVTFKVENGTWNDETDTDKEVILSGYEGDTLNLTPDQIPAVGSRPDKNYKAGSWDTEPGAEAAITGDTTYIYAYEKAYYTVTFVDGQGKTLKTEKVESDKAATAPADPKRSGYTFTGWDKSFSKVTGNMTVTAQWKKNAEPAPVAKISGILLSKMTAKGKNGFVLTWNKVKGAEGYDIFFSKCDKKAPEKVKTIKGNKTFKWMKSGLKKGTTYKAVVKAYVTKNGKKTYVRTSPMVHAYTSGGTKFYTNSKNVTVKKLSVSLNAGMTHKIKANVTKLRKGRKLPTGHAPKLRYVSSNKKIAAVSNSGKITAKSIGSCKVYVIAVNGARKAVTVTVKVR